VQPTGPARPAGSLPATMPAQPPPPLSPEQRRAALAVAASARRYRAQLREDLRTGRVRLADVLAAPIAEPVARMRVSALLESLPGIGPARSEALMALVGIAANRRVRGLGPHQVAALLRRIDR